MRSRRRRREATTLPPITLLPAPPPPPGEADTDGPVVLEVGPRPRRIGGPTSMFAALVLALAVLASALTYLVTYDEPPRDPVAALRAAQRLVEESDSFRFDMLQTSRLVTGELGGAGSDTTTREHTSGTVAARTRWHLLQELDESLGIDAEHFEAIRVGSTVFSTTGIFEEDSVDPNWLAAPATGFRVDMDDLVDLYEEARDEDGSLFSTAGDPDVVLLTLVMAAHVFDGSAEPAQIAKVIGRASKPTVVAELEDGGLRLAARLPAVDELDDLVDEPVRVAMEIDLDGDDTPRLVRLSAASGSASVEVVIRYSRWDAELVVEPPDEDEVDRTPWVSEESLAALDDRLLVAPTDLPDGMALVAVDVFDESDDGPPFGCEVLELSYEGGSALDVDPGDFDELTDEELEELFGSSLVLDVSTPICADRYDDSPFDAELGGLPARGGEGYWEVEVGRAVVSLESSLDEATLGAIVASIEPTTVDALVTELSQGPGAFQPTAPSIF